jgi:hypothetical protein
MLNDDNQHDFPDEARALKGPSDHLHIDPLEKKWIYVALGLIGVFVATIL